MNNVEFNNFVNVLWTKEAVIFLLADMQWKANEIEAKLKSPFPLLFFIQPEVQPQPIPNP